MGRRFKVWLDSGANSDSCYEQEVFLDDLGISEEKWDAMTADEKEAEMREVAFNQSDWGFREIAGESPDGTGNG
jgi:hypothetical protein